MLIQAVWHIDDHTGRCLLQTTNSFSMLCTGVLVQHAVAARGQTCLFMLARCAARAVTRCAVHQTQHIGLQTATPSMQLRQLLSQLLPAGSRCSCMQAGANAPKLVMSMQAAPSIRCTKNQQV